MGFASVNPATGARIATYAALDDRGLDHAIGDCHAAHLAWRETPFSRRAELLGRAAAALRSGAGALSRLMAMEMGKPVRDGISEVTKCADACEYFAARGEDFLRSEPVATEATRSYVAFEPLGPVLAVMPWNFPFWQVFRFAAPALMAGNGCLLKHAPNVQGCAAAIESLLLSAGCPPGLFRNLPITPEQAGKALEDPRVKAVTLTGSVGAGRSVAAKAGAMLKKCVLELGGSDAYLILEDADLEEAARVCAQSRLLNGGQSCIAAKRFLVAEPARGRFEALLAAAMSAVAPGDPLLEATGLGPLARADLRENLHRQVRESVSMGARLLLGGELPPGPGNFYPPTILTGVRPDMPAGREELFGPVAAVIPVTDEDEALRVANGSAYGLGAAVFTRDAARGERLAARLEAGNCFVNALVKSDPRLPFGGVKDSGYGRELSAFGIREFVNVKTVWIR